ncbi:hypothetical protein B0H13DRAFT_2677594 [Mycena leptocephala]|nr:hypothetical protein B0H13DRAFT_2677594 [Mycena leptocephala]
MQRGVEERGSRGGRKDGEEGVRKMYKYCRRAVFPVSSKEQNHERAQVLARCISMLVSVQRTASVHQVRAFALGLIRPRPYAFDISHAASYDPNGNEEGKIAST